MLKLSFKKVNKKRSINDIDSIDRNGVDTRLLNYRIYFKIIYDLLTISEAKECRISITIDLGYSFPLIHL